MTTDNTGGRVRGPEANGTPLNRLFAILSNHHRRRILTLLAAHPHGAQPLSLADLGTQNGDRERFEVGIHHIHLPMLEAGGYLEWDQTTDTIRRGSDFDAIEPALELFSAHVDVLPGAWA
jgi:hypothetical protein